MFSQATPSAFNSDQSKTAVATCPTNNSLVGMGANLFGGGGDVAIEQIMPDLTTQSVTVTAKETDLFSGSWEVWAWAMCVPNPAPAGLVVRTSVPSPNNSLDKSVTASCGPTETLFAIGYDVGNGFGEVLVNQVRPDAAPVSRRHRRPSAPTRTKRTRPTGRSPRTCCAARRSPASRWSPPPPRPARVHR